jgi:scyllo-inositol 2-dehydrogenase (NADP+)
MPAIHVGLVGFGAAGRVFHAPVIRGVPGLELRAILQRHGASAQEMYPDVRVVRDLDTLLADDGIRLVLIATPNVSHHELARQCLLAGRDVVVDKPFTVTSAEARDLVETAASRGRLLSVYQNRRWDGDFLTVRQLIASGALGRVVQFESRFDRYRPRRRPAAWRESDEPGSGILFDFGPHLLDQALVLFGMPQAITADVRLERDDAVVDDAFDILLHYPNLRVLLGATMLACAPGPRLLVHGTRGTYSKYGLDPQENALKAGGLPGSPGWGQEDESLWGVLSLAEDGSVERRAVRTQPGDYRLFYANVRDAIAGSAELAVTPQQALCVIRLLELARESSRRRLTMDCASEVLAY